MHPYQLLVGEKCQQMPCSVGLRFAEIMGLPGGGTCDLCISGSKYSSGIFGLSSIRKSLTFLVISPLCTITSSFFFYLDIMFSGGVIIKFLTI